MHTQLIYEYYYDYKQFMLTTHVVSNPAYDDVSNY